MKPCGVVCQQAASKKFILRDWHSKGTVRLLKNIIILLATFERRKRRPERFRKIISKQVAPPKLTVRAFESSLHKRPGCASIAEQGKPPQNCPAVQGMAVVCNNWDATKLLPS